MPPASPRRSLCSARLSGSHLLRSLPCAGSPAVRSCRRALFWPRCAHKRLCRRGRGGGTRQGQGGRGRGGRGPGGLCRSQPPNRCFPLRTIRRGRRGRWRAAGDRSKESEESHTTGLWTSAPSHQVVPPKSTLSAWHSHTDNRVPTLSQVQAHSRPVSHIWLHGHYSTSGLGRL